LEAFDAEWGRRYPAAIRLWRNAWAEFILFLDYDTEIRKVICSTNAIESLNACYRRAIQDPHVTAVGVIAARCGNCVEVC
jgi:transposase-like protein